MLFRSIQGAIGGNDDVVSGPALDRGGFVGQRVGLADIDGNGDRLARQSARIAAGVRAGRVQGNSFDIGARTRRFKSDHRSRVRLSCRKAGERIQAIDGKGAGARCRQAARKEIRGARDIVQNAKVNRIRRRYLARDGNKKPAV